MNRSAFIISALILLSVPHLIICFSRQNIQSCCSSESEGELLSCVKKSAQSRWDETTRSIAVVTYSSQDILNYSTFSHFVNEAYSSFNNYRYYVADSVNASFETLDPRWNKIRILSDAINPKSGWANETDYIVWVDADLIMTNFSFRFEQIIDKFPDAHVIASEDASKSDTVMNSGALILKNSKFTRQFLDRWWGYDDDYLKDHENFHKTLVRKYYNVFGEQSQLHAVYKWYEKQESKLAATKKKKSKKNAYASGDFNKITVLPSDSINSHNPAFLFQKDSNSVLHLMQDIAAVRTRAFKLAFDDICYALNISVMSPLLPPDVNSDTKTVDASSYDWIELLKPRRWDLPVSKQLALTRDVLQQLVIDEYSSECAQQAPKFQNMIEDDAVEIAFVNRLDLNYQRLCQVLDFRGDWTKADEVRSSNFASLMSYIDYYRKQNEATMKMNKGIGLPLWPAIMSKAADSCRRIVANSKHISGGKRRAIADKCKKLYRELEVIASPETRGGVQTSFMQLYVQIGEFELKEGDHYTARIAIEQAIDLCNKQQNTISCFLYPMFLHAEAISASEDWVKAIGSYDGVIANVIKTQQMRAGLTADDPELSKNQYEIGLIEPQGDLDVDTILMKSFMGRAYAFSKLGDTTAGQRDLDDTFAFIRKCSHKFEEAKELKKKVRDAIIEANEKEAEKNNRQEKEVNKFGM